MAVTKELNIDSKLDASNYNAVLLPVASGETIYKGTYAGVNASGYLVNLTSTTVKTARMVVKVIDGSANATPAATTANGSIANSISTTSAAAGDKTVRLCATNGRFIETFTSITQDDVGKTIYMTDNYTFTVSASVGIKVGTLVTYLSSTLGEIELNMFTQKDGTFYYKAAMTATTATTGGAVFAIANPYGESIYVTRLWIDITTGSTGSATIDIGVAADAVTSADTLIDGITSTIASTFDNTVNGGTNGKGVAKVTSGQYITGTASATLAGIVGFVAFTAISAE